MRDFLYKAAIKYQRFMYGRYGADKLSRFMFAVAVILMLLSFFKVLWFVYFIGLAVMMLSVLRGFSRNYTARTRELNAYLKIRNKIKNFFSLERRKWKERKTHRYFRCPVCKAVLRVPKGRGKITITCAKCGHKFDKKV